MRKIVFLFLIVSLLAGCKYLLKNQQEAVVVIQIDKENQEYIDKYSEESDIELYELVLPILKNRLKMNKVKMKYEIDSKSGVLKLFIKTSNDLETVYALIGSTGHFEFKIVSEEGTEVLNKLEKNADQSYYGEGFWKFQNVLDSKVSGTELVCIGNTEKWGDTNNFKFLAVKKESIFGEDLLIKNIKVKKSDYGMNVINFEFDKKDAEIWANITEKAAKNNERIAIILDKIVLMSPYVNERIPNGKCQLIMGTKSIDDLNYIAALMQYPQKIPIKVIENIEY